MSRLIMNHLQNEFGLIPSKVIKEDKGEYIRTLKLYQEEGLEEPFIDFMFEEHAKNLQNEIANYNLSMKDDEQEKPQRHFRR